MCDLLCEQIRQNIHLFQAICRQDNYSWPDKLKGYNNGKKNKLCTANKNGILLILNACYVLRKRRTIALKE